MYDALLSIPNIFIEWSAIQRSIDFWRGNTEINFYEIGYWVVVFFLLSLIFVWILSKKKTTRIFEFISNNLLVISLAIWLLGVLVYLLGLYRSELNGLSVIPRAVISSFKMFVVANDLARVRSELHDDAIYMSVFSLVHFAAAFITFIFIFKMIGYKIKSSWNILCHKWFRSEGNVIHLFWGVNEASCLLAEDIRKRYADETIIFIDIDDECEEKVPQKATLNHITNTITIKSSEIERLEEIGALVDHCYNGPAALNGGDEADVFGILHLRNVGAIVGKSKKTYFYFLSDDEVQNIAGALNLQRDSQLCTIGDERPTIYVHARRDANNEVFDHYSQYDGESQRMEIQIVDSAYLSIATLKQDDGALPVNCVEIDKMTGLVNSSFTALIIGFGGTGQEAFKFLYEYAAFVGADMKKSPFKCYAIDEKMNRIAGLVKEKMPAITEDELMMIHATIDSEVFWSKINSIMGELNYIVLALNDDALGLSLAVNLFKCALKNRTDSHDKLKIMIRCYDNGNERRMTEVADNLNSSIGGDSIEIRLYGRKSDLYCCDTILSDVILTEAKEFNRIYENSSLSAEEQWQKNFGDNEIARLMAKKKMSRYHAIYDINRRITQNISNSLHRRTKMILMGFGRDEISEKLKLYEGYTNTRNVGETRYDCNEYDAKLLQNIAMVEHERWVASHKLMGYTYSQKNDYVQKCHQCICPWKDLDEMTQSYDCNVVDTTIRMEYKSGIGVERK